MIVRENRINTQVFTRQNGNTKVENITSDISTESILILAKSNWIQRLYGLCGLSRLFGLSCLVEPGQPERPDEPDRRFTRNVSSGAFATNRHEAWGLGGYFSNVFEKDEEMQGITW